MSVFATVVSVFATVVVVVVLVFAGATRQKTEVLPTSAFLELQPGRTEGMLAVSLIMIAAAVVVFITARTLGMKRIFA